MSTKNTKGKVKPVSDEERSQIAAAISALHGTRIEPGEAIGIELERTREHSHVQLVLSTADETFMAEFEAAILEDDEHVSQPAPEAAFEIALDFLNRMVAEFLEDRDQMLLHEDWRIYNFEDVAVRFRGRRSRPDLEALADQWLAQGGDPDS